jgi:hypothetical protein
MTKAAAEEVEGKLITANDQLRMARENVTQLTKELAALPCKEDK